MGDVLLDILLGSVRRVSNVYGIVFFCGFITNPVESHVHTLRFFCLSTPVRMPCANLLLDFSGVGPCGCPISISVWRIGSVRNLVV